MNKFILLGLVIAVTSCAGNVKDKNLELHSSKIKGKNLDIVVTEAPSFWLMTGGTAGSWGGLLGPLGAFLADASARSNGYEMIKKNGIKDPAFSIASNLYSGMKERGFNINSEHPKSLETNDKEVIKNMYKDSDYVLSVGTQGWGTVHNLLNDLRILYSSKLQLTDIGSNTVVAESLCNHQTDAIYDYDELLEDNKGEQLKAVLKELNDKCIGQFRKVLGIK